MMGKQLIQFFVSLVVAMLLTPGIALAAATLTIVNIDGPGEGFNDPTRVKRVGGNPGKTLGEQRLIAFQFAADTWAATLDSNIEIRIQASFDPLFCTANSAVLGAASPIQIVSDFPGAQFPNTWYAVALANKRADQDLIPGAPGTSADDIRAFFNSNLGQPGCLEGSGFYLGLDNNHGNQLDLVTVLLHEFGHGLGFLSLVDESKGTQIHNQTDIFSRHLLDTTTGKTWDEMTAPERKNSAINSRHVTWTGPGVTAAVPIVLTGGTPFLRVNTPATIAGSYDVGPASFGPPLGSPGTTGDIVQAFDAADSVGPSTTDACSPITNAAAVAGRMALVDRGTCLFVTKVKNVQNAGAIAAIVADNVAGSPPAGFGGSDSTITIPSVRITLTDGNTIKSALAAGPVNGTLTVDSSVHAGADGSGHALVWTPNPVQPGSSISHWDIIAFPNQLMEPALNGDLTHSVNVPEDLTFKLLEDTGW